MRKLAITTAAALSALAAVCAWGDWVYEGKWGSYGSGGGQFNEPWGMCLNGPGSRVYVADPKNNRIQYFTSSGTIVAPASLGRVKALFK